MKPEGVLWAQESRKRQHIDSSLHRNDEVREWRSQENEGHTDECPDPKGGVSIMKPEGVLWAPVSREVREYEWIPAKGMPE